MSLHKDNGGRTFKAFRFKAQIGNESPTMLEVETQLECLHVNRELIYVGVCMYICLYLHTHACIHT